MYTIKLINSYDEWEQFNTNTPFSVFVQSRYYGEFYRKLGEEFWIIGVYTDNNILCGGSLVVSTHAKRGNFLYLPYGPIIDFEDDAMRIQFFDFLKKFAKEKKYDFVRISPLVEDKTSISTTLTSYGFRPAPMHVLAENSWILDLSKTEDCLLKEMKKNHRNLIRRCEKDGVIVKQYIDNKQALNRLHEMLDKTAKRHNFFRFSKKYINTEFKTFADRNQAMVFEATLPNGHVDASAIIMFYGNMAVYRHSASLHQDKRLPTSYLIQWEVIKEAKRRKKLWYNFWGVEPEGEKNHPFSGIGHFKRGFGGFQKDLLHCHDLPITYKYWINWIIESIRKIRRGF